MKMIMKDIHKKFRTYAYINSRRDPWLFTMRTYKLRSFWQIEVESNYIYKVHFVNIIGSKCESKLRVIGKYEDEVIVTG